ncbi:MAG: hypothetical protein JWP97_5227 [Labilithrix sp.]|nr:hypothetical protein [Labilithrix sp.]
MNTKLSSTFALVATFAALGACSSRAGFDEGGPRLGEPDGGVDGGRCGYRCSPDLKKVIKGCIGQAAEQETLCGPDQGCGVDACVPACDSAAGAKGSVGCSFWTLPPDDAHYGPGACFAAMIANTWDRGVTLRAEYGKEALDLSRSVYTVTRAGNDPVYTPLTGALPPGEVAVVFLAQAEVLLDAEANRCPPGVTAALHVDPIRHGTVKTTAFHLTTDAPVAAYSMFPYGGASSQYPTATLLLPVSSWDTSYLAVSTAKIGQSSTSSLDRRTLQIVAQEDGTEVSMRPVNDIGQGEDVAPAVTGEPVTWSLARGQVLQITQETTTTGSPVSSNKPVGMFGGSPCAFIPADKQYCDLTQQQIAPFSQWGTSYALVPYRPRTESIGGIVRESVPYSLVGAIAGTQLTYDPAPPPGAPTALEAGETVTFITDALVTVKSQDSKHPFHAAVYMTGSTFGGGNPAAGTTTGDPDFVNLVPTDQYLDRYVFFTDFTFPDTSLTIVRKKTATGFLPVTLACAGEVTGFAPLGTSGEYEMAWVRLTAGYVRQTYAAGECGYGRQEASSAAPFAVTVWGTGKDASYGYAAGAGSRPVNDAPPPVVR